MRIILTQTKDLQWQRIVGQVVVTQIKMLDGNKFTDFTRQRVEFVAVQIQFAQQTQTTNISRNLTNKRNN